MGRCTCERVRCKMDTPCRLSVFFSVSRQGYLRVLWSLRSLRSFFRSLQSQSQHGRCVVFPFCPFRPFWPVFPFPGPPSSPFRALFSSNGFGTRACTEPRGERGERERKRGSRGYCPVCSCCLVLFRYPSSLFSIRVVLQRANRQLMPLFWLCVC